MNILSNIFKSDSVPMADISNVLTDIHSHLLPDIDDGSPDMETSVSLIRRLQELGFKKLLLTPHVNNDTYNNSKETILEKLALLKKEIAENNINIELEASAEYHFDENFLEIYKKGELIKFGNDYILLELPHFLFPKNLDEVLFDMKTNGYNVIIAHPERYSYFYGNFERYEQLKDRDLLFQVNIYSYSNYYPFFTRKIAERLIKNNMVEFIGTDLHSENQIDYIKKGLKNKYLYSLIQSGKLLNKNI